MNPLTTIWLRLRSLGRAGDMKREIDEELRFHVEQRTAENIAAGMTPEDAARAARKRFGNLQSVREQCREARGARLRETMLQDVRFGARMLRKNPGFTAVAVLTLALGIGANTAIFSVVSAVLLRPLPYPEPDRLVAVCESNPHLGLDHYVTSLGAYADWRRENSVFQSLAAAAVLSPAPVFGPGGAELVQVAAVSAEFFPLLGIQPILGRQFLPEEENPDRGNAILLSEGLWRQRFGADPGILNQSIRLGGLSFTVVGVMPAGVRLFDPAGVQGWDNGFSKCDLWRPLPVDSGLRKQRGYRAFLVLGRLKPNVSLARARSEMTNIASQQARDYPDSNSGWGIEVQSWRDTIVRNARLPLILLLAAAGFVLLIATANLANLSLARAAFRQREFAIRLALGAGRLRIARQYLVESVLLSGLGGAFGVLLAQWSIGLLRGLIPADIPRSDEISLNVSVLAFALVVSLIVGLVFGMAPLMTFWRCDVNGSLKPGAQGFTGNPRGRRLRASLVASEVALVVILLTGAGLLTRSFQRLTDVDPGFRPAHLVALDLSVGGPGYTNESRRIQFVGQILARLSGLPGLESSAVVNGLPLDAGHGNMEIALTSIDGTPPATPDGKLIAALRLASPGYFSTMGIPISRGRSFTGRDNTNAPSVVVINETLAQRYFPGRDPVGKQIASPDFGPQPCEIVGVLKDVRQASFDRMPEPEVFRPLLQECFSSLTVVNRGVSDPARTLTALGEALAGVDRDWPAYNPRTLDRLVSASLAPRRFALLLIGLFAGLALLLAVIGIYGVLSCVVGERIREIGIRLALGAGRRDVFRMILARGMRSVAIGGLIGLAGAWALTRFLRSLLYEISPADPVTHVTVVLLLIIVALAACWLPARRAAGVDPAEALRHE